MRTELGQKRVRAYVDGVLVADGNPVLLVWEHERYPQYGFRAADINFERLREPSSAQAVGDDVYLMRWNAADAWFEEDEEVFVHPRNPYTRVDVLDSSRHVVITIAGVTVAESTHPRVLFETRLPPRFYLPPTHVRLDLLRPSSTVTQCPYKGSAHHWSAEVNGVVHDDVAWTYRTPLPESTRIAGLVAFYPEKVELVVDGERQA